MLHCVSVLKQHELQDFGIAGPSCSTPVLTYTFTGDLVWDTDVVPSPVGFNQEYKVATEVTHKILLGLTMGETQRVTRVTTKTGETIATLQWREMWADKVTFRDSPPMSMYSWMKSVGGMVVRSSSATFKDGSSRKYRWTNIATWQQMELHAEDTPNGAIAVFCRGGINPSTKDYKYSTLVLSARAHEIAELCVVSFLFLEKRRRAWESDQDKQGELARGRAQIMGVYAVTVGK